MHLVLHLTSDSCLEWRYLISLHLPLCNCKLLLLSPFLQLCFHFFNFSLVYYDVFFVINLSFSTLRSNNASLNSLWRSLRKLRRLIRFHWMLRSIWHCCLALFHICSDIIVYIFLQILNLKFWNNVKTAL